MNENLDLTKILDGCPEGTKFYSTIYGEVSFVKIYADCNPIELKSCTKPTQSSTYTYIFLTKDGRCFSQYDGECTLFPSKYQRDWSKFERFWDKPKKVEKFDPYTLQPFDKVLLREDGEQWKAALFSHIDNCSHGAMCCGYFIWKHCIPYNDETKHLLGTTDDCPEYYKWWEEHI